MMSKSDRNSDNYLKRKLDRFGHYPVCYPLQNTILMLDSLVLIIARIETKCQPKIRID